MGKQAVLAAIQSRTEYGTGPLGYIDADSVQDGHFAAASFYTQGATTHSGAALINAISQISSNNTKTTKIHLVGSTGEFNYGAGPVLTEPPMSFNLTIWIDWVGLKVQWSGYTSGLLCWAGSKSIDSGGSIIAIPHIGISYGALTLETGPSATIVRLPFVAIGGFVQKSSLDTNCYTITTDDGQVVTTSSTPPAETSTAEVSGVKISELNAVETLQDDDLFVLSQDEDSDETYDASYNVTLSTLKTSIGAGSFTPAITDSDVMSVLEQRGAGFSGTVSLTPPTGKKFAILSCQMDCDASGGGGNWFLVIGKNLDTDLPLGTYPAGAGTTYSAAQLDEIYKYSVAETSNTLSDPNGTNTNLRYVYVGGGGTISIPWRVLIQVGPSGTVAVTISVVGWV
tara:strand:- start:419 stop:1609 length:1191 start_codon:yes stop_codon:yes gene_type:complete